MKDVYVNMRKQSIDDPSIGIEPTIMEVSTPSCLDMNSLDIGEITEITDNALMSTSAVLYYCKSKILYPYLRFLGLVGLRPASLDQLQTSKFTTVISHLHTLNITFLVCLGYILQYMACFRRDRGFCHASTSLHLPGFNKTYEEICYGSTTFNYIVPNALHFAGFVYAIFLFRISDNEQLQNLMERVFLLSSFPPQGTLYTSPRTLLKTLWIYIILSMLWMVLSLTTVILMMSRGTIIFQWISEYSDSVKLVAKIFLPMSSFAHDVTQATIITSYCLQAQLLTAHLQFLRNRLLTKTISSLDWMREVAEFRKLLRHLNEVLAPAICLFTVVNLSWACSGMVWLLNLDRIDTVIEPVFGISMLNEFLWVMATFVPFVSAARLTTACSMTQGIGHEISVRPFLHQETPQEDLNAVLLYASTLQLSARLFRIPITGRYLCLIMTAICVILIILGMCHFIHI